MTLLYSKRPEIKITTNDTKGTEYKSVFLRVIVSIGALRGSPFLDDTGSCGGAVLAIITGDAALRFAGGLADLYRCRWLRESTCPNDS